MHVVLNRVLRHIRRGKVQPEKSEYIVIYEQDQVLQ